MKISNHTPYFGEPYLRVEHWDTDTDDPLNKVYARLGAFQLVSRIRTGSALVLDQHKIAKINALNITGGECTCGTMALKEDNRACPISLWQFITHGHTYIGGVETFMDFYNRRWLATDQPGIAIAMHNNRAYRNLLSLAPERTKKLDEHVLRQHAPDAIKGYVAYSHRGWRVFKVGDILFDPWYKDESLPMHKWGRYKIGSLDDSWLSAQRFKKYL